MLIRTNHNPGSTPQRILQIALVDPVNEHQQILGAVQELPPIDLGANQPFLAVTGQRFGVNTEYFTSGFSRQE